MKVYTITTMIFCLLFTSCGNDQEEEKECNCNCRSQEKQVQEKIADAPSEDKNELPHITEFKIYTRDGNTFALPVDPIFHGNQSIDPEILISSDPKAEKIDMRHMVSSTHAYVEYDISRPMGTDTIITIVGLCDLRESHKYRERTLATLKETESP